MPRFLLRLVRYSQAAFLRTAFLKHASPSRPSPLGAHHILLTYQVPKRSMFRSNAILTLFIDGCPLESEAKVDVPTILTNARVHIGVPNPVLASSGIVRGSLSI
jgi:hypothetical protein